MEMVLESPHWIVLNKPNGLLVEHSSWYDSLQDQVMERVSLKTRKPYVGIVHRLDRAVSGVVLIALRKSALTALQMQFEQRQTKKTYLALVQGHPQFSSATLEDTLLEDKPTKRAQVVKAGTPGAKAAVLHYRVLKSFSKHALLEIQLETGRFHQIRAQLAHAGFPILNDQKYGADLEDTCPMEAIGLHAWQLSFTDPSNKENVQAEAPLPLWWQMEFPQ